MATSLATRIGRAPNLVTQVERLLRDAIRQGRFLDGKLPTKVELATQLGVSRETIRRATETLAREGMLVKFRRKGTFVRAPQTRLPLAAAQSTILGYMQADYRLPSGEVESTMQYISSQMLQGAVEAADQADFELLVRQSTVANISKGFQKLSQAVPLRGVVFASVGEEKLMRRVAGLGLPMVLLDHDLHLPEISTIRDDSAAGARLAIEHLASLGHRHIAIANWYQADLNPWRLDGYRQALRELGLPRRRKWEIPTDLSPDGARKTAQELCELSPRPTAVYCFNNSLARQLVDELSRRGVRVPYEMSVVGGGGEEIAELTYHQADWRRIGRLGIEVLLAAIRTGDDRQSQNLLEPHSLHLGRSTAPPPGSGDRGPKAGSLGEIEVVTRPAAIDPWAF